VVGVYVGVNTLAINYRNQLDQDYEQMKHRSTQRCPLAVPRARRRLARGDRVGRQAPKESLWHSCLVNPQ
jgi:hypothetical protein